MAEIHDPRMGPSPSPTFKQSRTKGLSEKTMVAAIVTTIAGGWASFTGAVFYTFGSNYPWETIGTGIVLQGVALVSLGIVTVLAAFSMFNNNQNASVVSFFTEIILLFIYFLPVLSDLIFNALIGAALCFLSILTLIHSTQGDSS